MLVKMFENTKLVAIADLSDFEWEDILDFYEIQNLQGRIVIPAAVTVLEGRKCG